MMRVILWMSGALTFFCVMAVAVRALAAKLSIIEILAVRSGTGVLIVATVLALRPLRIAELRTRRPALHCGRNVIHLGATYLWSLGVVLLPFATVFALEFTTPAWVALFATVFLGERMSVSRFGAVVLGFLGVLVILRPGFEAFRPATLIVLASAVGFAVSVVIQKRLTETDTTFGILAWMNAIQFALSSVGVGLTADAFPFGRLTAADLPFLLGLGLGGFAAHFCMTNAFRSGDAVVVVPLDFLRVPLIAVIGFLFFGEALDPFVFAGSGLIVIGIIWSLFSESRLRRT
jgi:drug/metabolite transporter (DMT)-like permease